MVNSAKATGSGHLVWPEGSNAEDIPAEFMGVLNHALVITSWMENLPEDEVPPRWMWHLDWEIQSHFIKVKEEREKKYSSGKNKDEESEGPQAGAVHNEYASRFKN